MAALETVLRIPLGSLFPSRYPDSFSLKSTPILPFKPFSRSRKDLRCTNFHEISRLSKTVVRGNSYCSKNFVLKGKKLKSTRCKCQKQDSFTSIASEGLGSELKSDLDQNPLPGSGSFSSNGNVQSAGSIGAVHESYTKSIEDEAWDLLRQSVVLYCGSPI